MQTWIKYHSNARDHILPRLGHHTVPGIGTPDCETALHAIYDKNAGTGYRAAALAKHFSSRSWTTPLGRGAVRTTPREA